MYSTCIFCHSSLGANETLEHFPVGRRLAFDPARGRLWVICPSCSRWNLSPLEERWEVQEDCERLFRGTKLRYSTEQIGLARVGDGLELVRIGEPLRPEMAAWRYGRMFARRMRKTGVTALATAGVTGAVYWGLPAAGIALGGAGVLLNLGLAGATLYRQHVHTAALIRPENGEPIRLTLSDLLQSRLKRDRWDWYLELNPVVRRTPFPVRIAVALRDEVAIRAAGALLPVLNRGTGREKTVSAAVELLERARNTDDLFREASRSPAQRWSGSLAGTLVSLPVPMKLALEMASHEDAEREALEGDLRQLELAWKEAEEIAAIADNLLLPAGIEQKLARLRGGG